MGAGAISSPSEGSWGNCYTGLKKVGRGAQVAIENVVHVKDNANEMARVLKIAGYMRSVPAWYDPESSAYQLLPHLLWLWGFYL